MQIKIYVVMTEINKLKANLNMCNKCQNVPDLCKICYFEQIGILNRLKREICLKFGGLTEMGNIQGYWVDGDTICEDDVKIWEIYADNQNCDIYLLQLAKTLKILTEQKSQLYIINNKTHFI